MFTAHVQPAPRLRMSGSIPLLLLYAFMGWIGTTLFYTFVPIMLAVWAYYILYCVGNRNPDPSAVILFSVTIFFCQVAAN